MGVTASSAVLEAARGAYRRHEWIEARDGLRTAAASLPLGPDDELADVKRAAAWTEAAARWLRTLPATVQQLLADAYRRLGDAETAEVEAALARATLTQLGAAVARPAAGLPGGLSALGRSTHRPAMTLDSAPRCSGRRAGLASGRQQPDAPRS